MTCRVCNGESLSAVRQYVNGYWPGISEFANVSLMRCARCGFGFIEPEFSAPFLADFYRHRYRSKESPHYIDFSRLGNGVTNARATSQIELASRFVNVLPGETFLDVGPGAGMSFIAASNRFPGVRKVAIELTEEAPAAYERAFDAVTFRDNRSFIESGCKAKLILVSHCLEHFNPSAMAGFLDELKHMLAPGGVLVVEVPHADLELHSRYHMQDAPHCVFFSLNSLKELFTRNGWNVLFADTVGRRVSLHYQRRSEGIMPLKLVAKVINLSRRLAIGPLTWIRRMMVKAGIAKQMNFVYGGNRLALRLVARSGVNNDD